MIEKVFILGYPAIGKTTASNYVCNAIRKRTNKQTAEVNDYPFLKEMFRNDMADMTGMTQKKFTPVAPVGKFDIQEPFIPIIMNTALRELEKEATREVAAGKIVTIEFARDRYVNAFQNFSSAFLQKSCVLELEGIDIFTARELAQDRAMKGGIGSTLAENEFEAFSNRDPAWEGADLYRFLRTHQIDHEHRRYFIINGHPEKDPMQFYSDLDHAIDTIFPSAGIENKYSPSNREQEPF